MGMSTDDLKKECQYCYREIDNSGLEGFRCSNRNAIKAMDSGWCHPKCANEPCSMCNYCKPKEDNKMTIDKAIDRLEDLHFEQDDWECGELTDDCLLNREALRLAIDAMRKYQEIRKIYMTHHYTDEEVIEKIKEVIKLG